MWFKPSTLLYVIRHCILKAWLCLTGNLTLKENVVAALYEASLSIFAAEVRNKVIRSFSLYIPRRKRYPCPLLLDCSFKQVKFCKGFASLSPTFFSCHSALQNQVKAGEFSFFFTFSTGKGKKTENLMLMISFFFLNVNNKNVTFAF